MREHLYKAKRTDNGEWVEGSFVAHCYIVGYFDTTEIDKEQDLMLSQCVCHEIDPETVCQYIGIEDENKVKVFEGDEDNLGYVVTYNSILCGYQRVKNLGTCYLAESMDAYLSGKVSVFGNIHDKGEDQ